jgi:hypothetical protein
MLPPFAVRSKLPCANATVNFAETIPMPDIDRVFTRLYELKDPQKPLEIRDFADLGLSNNQLGECIRHLQSLGYADGDVFVTSRDDSGIVRIAARITPEGVAAYNRKYG